MYSLLNVPFSKACKYYSQEDRGIFKFPSPVAISTGVSPVEPTNERVLTLRAKDYRGFFAMLEI